MILIDTINSFKDLESNWDSYDADKISNDSITSAIQIVNSLEQSGLRIDNAFPMRDGGVKLEKDFKKSGSIEIEISSEKKIKLLIFNLNNDLVYENDFELKAMDNLIHRIDEYARTLHNQKRRQIVKKDPKNPQSL